ncbi:Organic cation/carnitine transporter 2, partial [Mucuna pruriens]
MEEGSRESNSVEQQDMIVSWDEMIEKGLGNLGWTQFLQCILVSVAMYFDSQQLFIAIYTDDYPTWHCIDHNTTCTSHSNICKLSKASWAWDGPSHKTIISHFGLQCATSFITALPQSSFFVGCLVGSFLLSSFIDSSFGRKNMIVMSCLSMSLISLIIIFSTNVWIYSAFKFLIGLCRSSISTYCLVLLTEKVSTKWRFTVGIVEFFFFTSGYLCLPAVAYLNRHSSWKYLYVWTSLPALCYSLVAYLFVTESPRWLLMQGRVQEAMAMLKGLSYSAAENGASLSASLSKTPEKEVSTFSQGLCLEQDYLQRMMYIYVKNNKKEGASLSQLYSSIALLLKTSCGPKRMVAVMGLGVGIGMVYFGMPLAVGNLDYNIYLGVVYNALMEIPSCAMTYFLGNCARKLSIFAFSLGSGICCIMIVVIRNVPQSVKVWLAVTSFFCACTAFNVFLIYIIELFPTCVRNTTASLTRQAISVFYIRGRKNYLFSYGVFGVVIIFSTFTLLSLPETKGMPLSDTMDQQETKETSLCEMG